MTILTKIAKGFGYKKCINLHKNISANKNFNAQNTEIKMKHMCIGQG
jgi:hypothetical protein